MLIILQSRLEGIQWVHPIKFVNYFILSFCFSGHTSYRLHFFFFLPFSLLFHTLNPSPSLSLSCPLFTSLPSFPVSLCSFDLNFKWVLLLYDFKQLYFSNWNFGTNLKIVFLFGIWKVLLTSTFLTKVSWKGIFITEQLNVVFS